MPGSKQLSSNLAENCLHLGKDVLGQISVYIFAPNEGYCLSSHRQRLNTEKKRMRERERERERKYFGVQTFDT